MLFFVLNKLSVLVERAILRSDPDGGFVPAGLGRLIYRWYGFDVWEFHRNLAWKASSRLYQAAWWASDRAALRGWAGFAECAMRRPILSTPARIAAEFGHVYTVHRLFGHMALHNKALQDEWDELLDFNREQPPYHEAVGPC